MQLLNWHIHEKKYKRLLIIDGRVGMYRGKMWTNKKRKEENHNHNHNHLYFNLFFKSPTCCFLGKINRYGFYGPGGFSFSNSQPPKDKRKTHGISNLKLKTRTFIQSPNATISSWLLLWCIICPSSTKSCNFLRLPPELREFQPPSSSCNCATTSKKLDSYTPNLSRPDSFIATI